MKKLFTRNCLVAAIGASLALTVSAGAVSEEFAFKSFSNSGVPSFVRGDLGAFSKADSVKSLIDFISAQEEFDYSSNDTFIVSSQHTDSLGYTHTTYSQKINGLKVFGTSLVAHSQLGQSGEKMYMLNGIKAKANPKDMRFISTNRSNSAEAAKAAAQSEGTVVSEPELGYEYMADTGKTELVYRTEVKYDMMHDVLFYSASSNSLLKRIPLNHSATRKTYDLQNGDSTKDNITKKLVCTDNESCGNDEQAKQAHEGAKDVDQYFSDVHGRDSFDDKGTALRSGVHLKNNENNAYFMWDEQYMAYGDGDGSTYNAFTNSFDVIAHEFTHGFTYATSNLEYKDESGALNESWSDVFGKVIDTYRAGKSVPDNWHLGVGIKKSGEPFRYMHKVTSDGRSKDYYPERTTDSSDNGGVHSNSGIGNLAFVLTVQGGTHPRDKTSIEVGDGIGMEKARNIWYRANNQKYLTKYSKFTDARSATMKAAQDLYGDAEEGAVCRAWSAVGVDEDDVSNCPSDDTATLTAKISFSCEKLVCAFDGTTSKGAETYDWKFGDKETSSDASPSHTYSVADTYTVELTVTGADGKTDKATEEVTVSENGNSLVNGQAINVKGTKGEESSRYTFDVPSGASNIKITMSGGTGDADMYVKFGEEPSENSYDCRPYKDGNEESCDNLTKTDGTYHVMLEAYNDFSEVSLKGSYDDEVVADLNAEFTSECNKLGCTFDSSKSTGSINTYSWDFGDKNQGSGASPSHDYNSAGDYTVVLTVTDNDGATDTFEKVVSVTTGTTSTTVDCSYTYSWSSWYQYWAGEQVVYQGSRYTANSLNWQENPSNSSSWDLDGVCQ